MTIGTNIRQARKTAGLNQEQVADYLGVARTTIVAIEQDQRRVQIHEIQGMAELFGLPPEALTEGEFPVHQELHPRIVQSTWHLLKDDEVKFITAFREHDIETMLRMIADNTGRKK